MKTIKVYTRTDKNLPKEQVLIRVPATWVDPCTSYTEYMHIKWTGDDASAYTKRFPTIEEAIDAAEHDVKSWVNYSVSNEEPKYELGDKEKCIRTYVRNFENKDQTITLMKDGKKFRVDFHSSDLHDPSPGVVSYPGLTAAEAQERISILLKGWKEYKVIKND